jgi:hypothetical protein
MTTTNTTSKIDPFHLYATAYKARREAVSAKEKAESEMISLLTARIESEMLRRGLRELSEETTREAIDLARLYIYNDEFGPDHLWLVDAVEACITSRYRGADI